MFLLLYFFGLAAVTIAQKCPLQFDGRVPSSAVLTSFDSSSSLFNPTYNLGANLKWSDVLLFPSVDASLFDANGTKAVEVTINDKSIFTPSATDAQTGFRRAELMPASNTGTDPSTTGIKTVHFSVMKDPTRPLNTSHEYQLFFLESSDYSTNQVVLKYGTIIGGNSGANPDSLFLVGNVNSNPVKTIYSTRFTPSVWHNFGITIDFNKGTTQVYYSTNGDALKSTGAAVTNNVAGQGEYHFGILKKPIGGGSDITKSGFQEKGINEGVVFGGIFEEDSTGGCISLKP
ncbi:glycoside hydrolase family 131 protein [Hyaloscypha variabilis]